mgnify:CR=1 FL=1
MPLLFQDLPEGLSEQYVCGKCMHLAAALHRRFGFPIEVCVEVPGTPHQNREKPRGLARGRERARRSLARFGFSDTRETLAP